MREAEPVFVDSGAWIALALAADPLHAQARERWGLLRALGRSSKRRFLLSLKRSRPIVIETFTFLDRNANRNVALAWKERIYKPGTVKIVACELLDMEHSWAYFRRADLHKLSVVDATSFAIMERTRIRLAYRNDRKGTQSAGCPRWARHRD